MTTYTYTGFRITLSGATATAAAMSTFSLTTSDSFLFKYALDAGATGTMPGINLVPTVGENYKTMVGTTRVVLDSTAYVTEFHWGVGNVAQALVFKVPGETGVMHLFQLSGDWLPMMDTAAKYNTFIASATATGTLTGTKAPGFAFSPALIQSPKVTNYNDTLIANSAFDTWGPLKTILTGSGNDRVEALETSDKIDLGIGNDTALGHGGNDSIIGGVGADSILGEAGADSLSGGLGADTMDGGTENDRIFGGLDNDSIIGGTGNDLLNGDDGLDRLYGGAGVDTINGGTGNDLLDGSTENDLLAGGTGNDTMDGGTENDRLDGGSGDDSMLGGLGNDYLSGADGNDFIYGGAGIDTLYGGLGNDSMDGGSENDLLTGGTGADTILGGSGSDTLSGSDGVDNLYGGTGNDFLTGGINADNFQFAKTFGADRVIDFVNDVDQLMLNHNLGLGIATVSDALSAATQVGANVVFDFGSGDILTVLNITKSALTNDIVFA